MGPTASETDDDRSVSPLMCTYLPIGELCHSGDLCLKKKNPPTHYRFHHLPDTLRSNTFSRAGRSASRRQSQASRYLSLPRSPVCEVKKRRIYLREEFESIIYSHSHCHRSPEGRLYCIFMNDPVYQRTRGSCFNITTAAANSCCQTTKITYFQALNLNVTS